MTDIDDTHTDLYGPVTDWANDFDHAVPEYNERAHEIWAEFQATECPMARSERYSGLWAPFSHEFVHEIAFIARRLLWQTPKITVLLLV